MNETPLLAIVGRPNVGKSTLYNRLVGGRPALVHDTPGLTRDRRYGEFDYFGYHFRVVDTGGLDPQAEADVIGAGIHRQARAAIEQSDAVIFVVDANAGINPLDREVAAMLRTVNKPVFCAANKMDHPKRDVLAAEMYALGMGEVFLISAAHGRGVDDLIDAVVKRLDLPPPVHEEEPQDDDEEEEFADAPDTEQVPGGGDGEEYEGYQGPEVYQDGYEDGEEEGYADGGLNQAGDMAVHADDETGEPLRVAFVGKPNAGKSSLMNRLVGTERSLVHHEPGTTTDPVDTAFSFGGRSYVLVDTAGIRRKARIESETEKLAVTLALSQIERADVVVLVIDGHLGPSTQDARLASAIEEQGRAVVIALNKADLLSGPGAATALKKQLREALHFVPYAPVVLISALRGDGVGNLMETIDAVAAQHRRRISTSELNRFFAEVCETHPPQLYRGLNVRIYYLTQGGIRPPTFLLWANRPAGVSPSYRRYVRNQLRSRYGFRGTPLRLIIKLKRGDRRKDKEKSGDRRKSSKRR